ncbi:MAG TPA: LpqB family beta-propeller domain-containing protein, partial [Thermoanaerobaculia bacterium]|nr:LpqB family beta-propeller domain-containing protein [Thermoanaerobaculia bacterium]
RVTFGAGLEDEPTFSPDGRFLAYTTDEQGSLDVVVQPLAGGETIRVAATDADEAQPAWSPDGSRIAFVSARDHGGRLGIALGVSALEPYLNSKLGDIFLAPALGGAPSKLVEDAYYPSWSPDGKRIVFMALRDGEFDLWTVPADGGTPSRLTHDADFDYQPSWSPDGQWIAYGSGPLSGPHNLRVISAAGGAPKTLTKDYVYVTRPAWSADSRTIFFAGERDGISNAWRMAFSPDGSSSAAERVTIGQGQDANLSISRDGKRLAFATVRNEFNIWELTLETGKLRQITSGSGNADYPQPSPDGKLLLVSSMRSGSQASWTVDWNGKFLSQLTPGQVVEEAAKWSPDGREIVYFDDHARMKIQSVGSMNSRDTGVAGTFADWSPDGKQIAVSGDRTSGIRFVIYSLADGKTRPIGQQTLQGPTWSPDGKRIACFSDVGAIRELWLVPVDGGEPRRMTSGEEDSHPAWSAHDPDKILFLRDHKRLALLSVSTGQVTFLPGYSEGSFILDYPAWSVDGKRVYFSVSRKSGDIYVLEGS